MGLRLGADKFTDCARYQAWVTKIETHTTLVAFYGALASRRAL